MAEHSIHTVAVAQGTAVIDDVDQNLATLSRLASDAARQGAEIVVTPELFATGYAPERAWRHDGRAIRASLADIARELGVTLVASTIDSDSDSDSDAGAGGGEGSGGGRHRVAASVFGPDGDEITRVHKRHLFGGSEQEWLTPGESYGEPFDLGGTSWGVGICYDIEFPEFARSMAVAGADILLVPTAVPTVEEGVDGVSGAGAAGEAWHYSSTLTSLLQVPARALESGVVVAYANHCGPGFTGRSCIATPFGRHAALLGEEEGVAVVQVSTAAIHAARRVNTYLPDLARASALPLHPQEDQ